MRQYKQYSYNGETHTVKEWSALLGISMQQVRTRIVMELPLEKNVRQGRKRKYDELKYQGRIVEIDEALEICGCTKATLYKYLEKGMSVESIEKLMKENRIDQLEFVEGWLPITAFADKFRLQKNHIKKVLSLNPQYETRIFISTRGKVQAVRMADLGSIAFKVMEYSKKLSEQQQKWAAAKQKKKEEEQQSLEEMKKNKPWITDPRCFDFNWWPKVEMLDFERWCNDEDYC